MKKILFNVTMLLLLTSFNMTDNTAITNECDIKQFYEAITPDDGVKVLTTMGNLEEVQLILIPTKIDIGNYEIEITRKGSNLYKIEGTSYYFETRYCYEFATYDDAILKVESNHGFTKGVIIFD